MENKNYYENYHYENLMSDLNNINDIGELDEEQVLLLKEKFKQVEASLKDKIKPKTITISGPVHNKIKKYCLDKELNIGDWCESVLIKEINNDINNDINESIINIYLANNSLTKLFKSVKNIDCTYMLEGTNYEILENDVKILEKKHKYLYTTQDTKVKEENEKYMFFKLNFHNNVSYMEFKNVINNVMSENHAEIFCGKQLIDNTGDLINIFTSISGKSNVDSPFDKKTHSSFIPEKMKNIVEFMGLPSIPEKMKNIVEFMGLSRIDGMPIFKAMINRNSSYFLDVEKMTFEPNKSMLSQIVNIFGYDLSKSDIDLVIISSFKDHITN